MPDTEKNSGAWVEGLADFLRREPGVSAVRIQTGTHKVEVATTGDVDLAGLQAKLRETIAAVDLQFGGAARVKAPRGFTLRQQDGSTQLARETSETVEKLWLWREVEWPDISPQVEVYESAWWELATLAAVCGACGLGGFMLQHLVPEQPWWSRGLFLVGLLTGGWDAARDSWGNLKTLRLDIHF
ncbi:MAG: cation-transporting P-type ATPase, partial [Opitutales bacterium]